MIVIVGAGLAGLSTAYHLSSTPYRLYEREEEVGGLCRSYHKDGFTFDYTGHLLHFRQPEIKALVERLLAGKLQQHSRKSFIYSHRTYTEYPFQVELLWPASRSDSRLPAGIDCHTDETGRDHRSKGTLVQAMDSGQSWRGHGQTFHGTVQRKTVASVAG